MSGKTADIEADKISAPEVTGVLAQVSRYYSDKLAKHGPTPAGVDWKNGESQELRFRQFLGLFRDASEPLSVNDLGCGYGAFYDYLARLGMACEYVGADISLAMIEQARLLHSGSPNCRLVVGAGELPVADYTVASGIFNVKLGTSQAAWEAGMRDTIRSMDRLSRRGFAFNCLTIYSDADKMVDRLYYADPCQYFDFCKRSFSPHVALLHDYGLYEFTLLVRKDI